MIHIHNCADGRVTEPGLHRMTAEQYHADACISKSGLDRIAKSPAHYRAWLTQPHKPSKAMQIGTALHALVLEGIAPTVRPDFSGKGSVAARAEWDASHAGALILDADDAADVHAMAASIAVHPVAGVVFRRADGRAEQSIKWRCSDTGAICKSRLDWIIPGAIVDLKTTADASPAAFARSVASYRYHVQDAFYSQAAASAGIAAEHFVFVCVESSPPYSVALYQLDDAARTEGRRLYLRDLETYMRCMERDEWPAYPTDIQTLSLPAWAYKGSNDEQ